MKRLSTGFAFSLLAAATVCGGDWPQWRGPDRSNRVSDFTPPAVWPTQLTQKWKIPVGDGVASPTLVGDRLFVFARQGDDEVIMGIDAADGKVAWTDKYFAPAITGPAGGFKGPRGTPAVADGKVCTFGTAGVITCHDARTGKQLWKKETKGTPGFKTSYSPVIADGKCIVHSGGGGKGGGGKGKGGGGKGGGGKGEIVAYDLKDGTESWKWPGDPPAYSSPVLMTVQGTPLVVAMTTTRAVGLAVADGKLLFEKPFRAARYDNTVTPIAHGDTLILSGNGTGTLALKVEKSGDGFTVKELWKSEHSPHMYNSPTLKDGRIYGMSGAGRGGSKLYCLDAKTGELLWEDKTTRGQCGSVLDAGAVMLALSSDSNLLAFKPGGDKYEELAKIKVASTETWAVPIVTGKRVFVKDKESLILWTFE